MNPMSPLPPHAARPPVFACIEAYAPGFQASVLGRDILTPPDLERVFGLPGGVRISPCTPLPGVPSSEGGQWQRPCGEGTEEGSDLGSGTSWETGGSTC